LHKPVPYIEPEIQGCSVFLYETVNDAEAGARYGGSGFLISTRSEADPSIVHLYAVSNAHVVRNFPIIRLVRPGGVVEVQDHAYDDWFRFGEGLEQEHQDDVAICALGAVAEHDYWHVPDSSVVLPMYFGNELVSVGDDCLMIGRYLNHDNVQFDQPVARFGNLAMMPEPVWQPDRFRYQESFLVDMRSMAGYSGSPVFLYIGGWPARIGPKQPGEPQDVLAPVKWRMGQTFLLGVDWGHLPEAVDLFDADGVVIGSATSHSGIAGVVPAWRILELLREPRVKEPRAEKEAELRKQSPRASALDSATRPFTADYFGEAVSRATRQVTPPAESEPEGKDK
jgi:hypothetical protein